MYCTLVMPYACPHCTRVGEFDFQFHVGPKSDLPRYRMGDLVVREGEWCWYTEEQRNFFAGTKGVPAWCWGCPHCRRDIGDGPGHDFMVILRDAKIVGLQAVSANLALADNGYWNFDHTPPTRGTLPDF